MRLSRRGAFAAVAIVWLSGAGCKYDPHPADGTLRCSLAGECPEGYVCRANACFSNNAIPATVLNQYIGAWTMGATANVVTKCGTAAPTTGSLSDTLSMTIDPGVVSGSDLHATWLCDLHLRLNQSGAHLLSMDGACTDTTSDPASTWTTTQFDVVTTDGLTAVHTAQYNRVDSYADGTVVNCSQTVHAPLTKN
jgi:hypothetical protein